MTPVFDMYKIKYCLGCVVQCNTVDNHFDRSHCLPLTNLLKTKSTTINCQNFKCYTYLRNCIGTIIPISKFCFILCRRSRHRSEDNTFINDLFLFVQNFYPRQKAEAFVIYTFLNLLYDYLGGEGSILNAVNGVPFQGNFLFFLFWLTKLILFRKLGFVHMLPDWYAVYDSDATFLQEGNTTSKL